MPFFVLVVKNDYLHIFNNVFGGNQDGSVLAGMTNLERKIWFPSLPQNIIIYWLPTESLYKATYITAMNLVESFIELETPFSPNDNDWVDDPEFYSLRFTGILEEMNLM